MTRPTWSSRKFTKLEPADVTPVPDAPQREPEPARQISTYRAKEQREAGNLWQERPDRAGVKKGGRNEEAGPPPPGLDRGDGLQRGESEMTEPKPTRRAPHEISIALDAEVISALRPEAARRDTAVPQLARDLIGIVVRDRLVSAVLDTD
jgi:hypothetical protein